MECNKDEAKRAIDIAEKKLSENDYVGAKKYVNKAQNLYPQLDSLKQVLTMINVYVSATNNINGGRETDWYGVLGVDPLANDEVLKKQYKKLALLLHPDKNRFNGAEGAFKLVLNAWSLLSDKAKRISYDQRRKLNTRTQNQHKPASSNGNQNAKARSNQPASGPQRPSYAHKPASSSGNQNARDGVDPNAKARSNKNAPGGTFWTMCNGCKTRCEYRRDYYLNKAVLCPNCGKTYIATEWASNVRQGNFSSSPSESYVYKPLTVRLRLSQKLWQQQQKASKRCRFK